MTEIIHELSAEDVERLELGIPIYIGGNHYVQSKSYVEKMLQDDLEYKTIEEELNNEYYAI